MTVSWTNLVCVCLSLYATGAVSQTFQVEPTNSTAHRGSDVRFNATVQGTWRVMTWRVGGIMVLNFPIEGNITSDSERFSAAFCSGGDTSCVEFTIHDVTREDSGPIVCSVLGAFGEKTANLFVEESGTVSITGQNVTAEQEQLVEFQCVATAWCPEAIVGWFLNGQPVDSGLYNTTSVTDGHCSNSSSLLKFQAVSSATVECQGTLQTLTQPRASSVFLTVVPKPPDWTVLIAVVVSFGSFALLVLLILGIIFCYKRRKEKQPNYQDEMSRRVRTMSQLGVANGADQKQGQANGGYTPDGRSSISPSEFNDSGFFQANGFNIAEGPAVVTNNQGGNDSVDVQVFMKHRHVTIV